MRKLTQPLEQDHKGSGKKIFCNTICSMFGEDLKPRRELFRTRFEERIRCLVNKWFHVDRKHSKE